MPIASKLKAFAAGIFAAGVVFNARDVAQAQRTALMVALELGLNLLGGVVEDQVVGSSRRAVAALFREFSRSKAAQCALAGQRPGRQVVLVVDAARADGQVRIAP